MGAGFLCVGPLAERLGRRGMFLLMHLCAAAVVPVTCYVPQSYGQLLALLPVYGFFTGGIHAGYAIYSRSSSPTTSAPPAPASASTAAASSRRRSCGPRDGSRACPASTSAWR